MALTTNGLNPVASAPVNSEAKKLSAEKHRKKVAAAREADHKSALAERDELKALGVFDKLTQATKDAILARCIPPSERKILRASGGSPMFNSIFGADPKVGGSVTLEHVAKTFFKGNVEMSKYIKDWAKKGIVVELKKDTTNIGASTYTIKALPAK